MALPRLQLYAYTVSNFPPFHHSNPTNPNLPARSLPHQRPWHRQRPDRDLEPRFRHHGPDHRHVRQSGDLGARLYERRIVHCCRRHLSCPAV